MDSPLLREYCNRLQGSQCKHLETENKINFGWQYTNVQTCRRVNGALGVRSIGTHPVSEEFSEIEWAVRLGLHHLFRIRKTLLTSTASCDQVEGRKISKCSRHIAKVLALLPVNFSCNPLESNSVKWLKYPEAKPPYCYYGHWY